jgi:hypothetical protein
MPDWSLVSRAHVLAAMKEYDELGSREFLRRYGFGRSTAYTLWHRGQEYDPVATLGAAYFHATGAAARSDELSGELSGGKDGAAKVLSDLGFDVVVDEEALAAEKPRRAKTVTAKPKAARNASPKVCPTCHMALPASGVCDFCD